MLNYEFTSKYNGLIFYMEMAILFFSTGSQWQFLQKKFYCLGRKWKHVDVEVQEEFNIWREEQIVRSISRLLGLENTQIIVKQNHSLSKSRNADIFFFLFCVGIHDPKNSIYLNIFTLNIDKFVRELFII